MGRTGGVERLRHLPSTAPGSGVWSSAPIQGVRVKTYSSSQIRNVVLVGHGGAGKTALAEAMLLRAGAINRVGGVMDHDPEEKEKGFSMSLALAQFEWRDHKINLLDTPGFPDFVGEVAAALRVADLAVFVVSAVEGIEVQTELIWRMVERPSAWSRRNARRSERSSGVVTRVRIGIAPSAGRRGNRFFRSARPKTSRSKSGVAVGRAESLPSHSISCGAGMVSRSTRTPEIGCGVSPRSVPMSGFEGAGFAMMRPFSHEPPSRSTHGG